MKSTDRYEVLDKLGEGGMGCVYLVRDRRQDEEIALKTLRGAERAAPAEIARFKREFRSLSGVVHPNLVQLYELEVVGGAWSITMELVRGVDFFSHLRPSGASSPTVQESPSSTIVEPPGEPAGEGSASPGAVPRGTPLDAEAMTRLRAAAIQLARGLDALHLAEKLHCDIKPSNVLVTPEGRVVVLDFGLVTEISPDPFRAGVQREMAGTVGYMAPEQLLPMPLTTAVDWYAFGVLLYEALTGTLPFRGKVGEVLEAKRTRDPPRPRALVPSIPEDLDELCVELLRRSPAERPESPEIFERLGERRSSIPEITSAPRGGAFVGRARELAELRRAFETLRTGRAVTVLVHGASGLGKSTLVQRSLAELSRRERLLVLSGRCYEYESIPFKALDGIVDRLAQHLAEIAPAQAEALIPPDIAFLSQIFPVLNRVPVIAARPPPPLAIPDRQVLRQRAFGALRELLRRLAARAPLALLIDDIQWGDADSAALLIDLFSPPSPPILLVACYRTDDQRSSPLLVALLEQWNNPRTGHDICELALEPLSAGESQELAEVLLERQGPVSSGLARMIALEGDGSPLFTQELARRALSPREARATEEGTARLDDLLRERVALLGEDERRLLEIVAVAGHPVPEEAAIRASAASSPGRALGRLRAMNLTLHRGLSGSPRIEPYHDRIRETVARGLSPELRRTRHLSLATALAELPETEPELLFEHFREGGAPRKAARFAVLAAERAYAALAFSHAVALYRAALEGGAGDGAAWILRTKLAESLTNAGRGSEAAASFAIAANELDAQRPGGIDALDLRRRAAEQYLRSGRIDEGLSLLREVLSAVGDRFPETPAGALFSLVNGRARLRLRGLHFTLRPPEHVPATDRVKVEIYWSAGVGLSMVDPVRAAHFQTRHERLALDLGEPVNVARGLASQVASMASEGGAANRGRLGEVLETAERLAREIADPQILMLTHFCAGTAAYFCGQWRRAVEHYQTAQEIGRARCVGVTWEMDSAELLELWAIAYTGDLPELSRKLPLLLKSARDRDDVFAATGLRLGLPTMVWLARDRPDEAEQQITAAMQGWTAKGFYSQHYFELVARVQLALYRGDGRAALDLVKAAWPQLKSSLLLRLQIIRIELLHLHARAALASVAPRDGVHTPASSADTRRVLRKAQKLASRIAEEDMPWASPLAALIEAGVSAGEGRAGEAAGLLDGAARALDALDMALYATAARFQRGRLIGGAAGRASRGSTDEWMRARGIEDPAAMAAMLVPVSVGPL